MIVIGAGRVGRALTARAADAGQSCALVSRDEGWEVLDGAPGVPVIVAVRNDDLEEVVARVPVFRREDLVLVQNGMIRPWLRAHGLTSVTRGLLYFAVPTRGHLGVPGRPSPLCGPHSVTVAHWLTTLGLAGWSVDWARFTYLEVEKLVWICAVGPLCKHTGATVGEVVEDHREQLAALVSELSRVCRASMGVDVPDDYLLDRLCGYSRTIPDFRASMSEQPWRNGWFVSEAERCRVATPVHHAVLGAVGVSY